MSFRPSLRLSNMLLITVSACTFLTAQELPKVLMRDMNITEFRWDPNNGDGLMVGKDRSTRLWGMYQVLDKNEWKAYIPAVYDSIDFFDFNGLFTGVWKDGYVGIYLSPWSFDSAFQSTPCIFESLKEFNVEWTYYTESGQALRTYLPYAAVQKNGLWAWIDWYKGTLMTEFLYDLSEETMPYPGYKQEY